MSIPVSVIIPIYNVERFLIKCLDSVIYQTFNNIEIIAINDGSTDRSGRLLDDYKKIHTNIKVIHKSNEGLSETRNKGLKLAKGEYVVFIDSDDYISSDMIESMYKKAIKTQAEIVISKVIYEYPDGKQISMFKRDFNEIETIDGYEAIKRFWNGEINGHCWNKLIKRDLMINSGIHFPVGKYYEDAPTLINLLQQAKKISFSNKGLYYYLQREGSITKKHTLDSLCDQIEIINIIKEIIDVKYFNVVYKKEFQFFLLKNLYFNLYSLNSIVCEDRNIIIEYKKNINNHIKLLQMRNLINNKYFSISDRVRLILIKMNIVWLLKYIKQKNNH
ncbi:glycosyltransferase [Bacillus gobiensis]|uniref:glycosyltransferase family 2 protein n=1 Tax=Bacillus gobiensis TaxID=1441095 RepID=UPI003D251154